MPINGQSTKTIKERSEQPVESRHASLSESIEQFWHTFPLSAIPVDVK